ncbi:MAG: hypothetical protein KDC54_18105, partial [Lewinella sp.]|nr:hypothetical protein [Lewinella sp.]
PDRLQEELIRLNFKTALPELEVSASVAGLEEELEHFIDEVNAVGLYQLPLQSKTLTLAKQQKNLEQIISQLERTLTGLADYDDFYAWQRNWFSLAEPARKVLSALIRVRPKHWEAAFGSWYFNECLVQNYQPLASLPSDSLQQFADDYALTSAQTPLVIRKTWESLRDAGARELRPLSRTWPEQAPDNFLAGQFAQAGSALTRFLPVWLVTPAVGAQLAPYFDQVLVVDAHTLGGDAAAWLHEARQVVLFSNQDHLTAQGSLVAQCERGDIPVAQLQESHRLPLLPRMAAGEVTVTYEQVEGRFLEDHLQNEVEAQAILRWLNQVEKMPNRTFPSVGILTATPAQRNLILQYFHTIKAKKQPGAEIIQQLERNGMQVLTWTEAVGQKFDQVVLSTVFGMIDAEGHLPADLPAWLSRARLEAAFSSVQQSLHLVTSVPEDELQAWLEQPTSGDGQWLALFLLAAEARATGQEAVLQQMQAAFPELQPPPLETPDSLPREVAHRLMDLLPGWSWEWKAPGPGKLPLLQFHNPEGQTALLLVDGFLAQSTYTHYSWEWNHRQALEREGYYLLSIQSEAWWKASGQEALRLSGALRGMATVATEEEE